MVCLHIVIWTVQDLLHVTVEPSVVLLSASICLVIMLQDTDLYQQYRVKKSTKNHNQNHPKSPNRSISNKRAVYISLIMLIVLTIVNTFII